MPDITSKLDEKREKTIQTVTRIAREWFPALMLVFNIALAVVFRLFTTSVQNPFTLEFFVNLAINLLTTMLCYVCFVKYGERCARMNSPTYEGNIERWSKMSGAIRSNRTLEFIKYCQEQVEMERDEIRHICILNHTMISVDDYESKYKKMTEQQIDSLVAGGELSDREAKYIKKANAPKKLKPINPMMILCGLKKQTLNDVGRNGMSAEEAAILSRPISMLIVNAVTTMFAGQWRGFDNVLFEIVCAAMAIVITSVAGYYAGVDAFNQENERIKGRICFLEKFLNDGNKGESQDSPCS